MHKNSRCIRILLKFLAAAFACLLIFSSCASLGGANQNALQFYDDYISIADTYFSQEKYDKAIKYYKLALESKENYWTVYYRLGKTYVYNKSWDEAAEVFKNILQRDEENTTIKSAYAYILAMQGNLEASLKIYDELIKKYPEIEAYLDNYIAIQFLYEENLADIGISIYSLMEKFPESEYVKKFNTQYDRLYEERKQKEQEEQKEKVQSASDNENEVEINTGDEFQPLLTD